MAKDARSRNSPKAALPISEQLRQLDQLIRPILAAIASSAALRSALPGLVAVGFGSAAMGMLGPGGVDREIAAESAVVAGRVRQDADLLRPELHAPVVGPGRPAQPVEEQAYLAQLTALAAESGVNITRLTPTPGDRGLLEIESQAKFAGFLRFATGIELQQAVMHGLQMRAGPVANGSLDISFSLELPHQAAESGLRTDQARLAAADPTLRDPFAEPAREGETAGHRLTGITEIGSTFIATIDDLDYQPGDRLGDMTVTAVTADEVSLTVGGRQVRLHFKPPGR